jgi:hypothetical protein
MADVKFLANLDVDGNLNLTAGSGYQIKNATFESLTADPTTNNFEGRMIYRSDTNQVRFYDGSAWTSIAGDILGVTAGDGLGGGGTTGTVSLSVNVDDVTTQITSDAVVAKTAAVSEGGENLATGGQIYSFVTDFNYLQGNQTITLSGDVTGSGTTAITTTIAANAVEGSMLNNNVISGQTALTTGLASTDELMVSDAGTLKRMDVSVLQSYMQSNLTFTTNTDTDVSVSNLETRLGQIDSNVTIGNGSSVNTSTSGNLTVEGNLIVNGTTTTVNSTTVAIDDHHFKVATDNAGTNDFGFYGRYNSTAGFAGLFYDVSAEQWVFYHNNSTEPGNTTFTPDEIATIKAQLVGDVTGNASTASAWANARTITLGGDLTGSVSIDGSANKTLTATIAANSVALGTDTTGNYVATIANATNGGLTVYNSGAESAAVTIGLDYAGTDSFGVLATDSTGTTMATEDTFLIVRNGGNVERVSQSDIAVDVAAASTTARGTVELATSTETKAGTDTTRAVTPSGLKSTKFITTIGDGAATSYTVTHNLGSRRVMVQMYDSSSYETVYAQVVRTSTTVCTIDFNTAPALNDVTVICQLIF